MNFRAANIKGLGDLIFLMLIKAGKIKNVSGSDGMRESVNTIILLPYQLLEEYKYKSRDKSWVKLKNKLFFNFVFKFLFIKILIFIILNFTKHLNLNWGGVLNINIIFLIFTIITISLKHLHICTYLSNLT